MEIFLVGGAVRDQLLGLPCKDQDWVVVGATPEEMQAQGYRPVGRDFPVFLHPQTQEEYALARTERKSGHGYSGFTCHAAADVTLEEDLKRRDLTINAMAQDGEGNIIDPYGGQQDLQARKLRHISSAFAEDPLRVLRVARFQARFADLGFQVAAETIALMEKMSLSGELEHLVPERIWQETSRALMESSPACYFATLLQCQALQVILPSIATSLEKANLNFEALKRASEANAAPHIRFACIACPDPGSDMHKQINDIHKRLKLPTEYWDLLQLLVKAWPIWKALDQGSLQPEKMIALFNLADLWRRPQRLDDLLFCFSYLQQQSGQTSTLIKHTAQTAAGVNIGDLIKAGHKGAELGKAIQTARLEAIANVIETRP